MFSGCHPLAIARLISRGNVTDEKFARLQDQNSTRNNHTRFQIPGWRIVAVDSRATMGNYIGKLPGIWNGEYSNRIG